MGYFILSWLKPSEINREERWLSAFSRGRGGVMCRSGGDPRGRERGGGLERVLGPEWQAGQAGAYLKKQTLPGHSLCLRREVLPAQGPVLTASALRTLPSQAGSAAGTQEEEGREAPHEPAAWRSGESWHSALGSRSAAGAWSRAGQPRPSCCHCQG